MKYKKVVMGLSGGMDSATLLGMLLNERAAVHVCNFQYGSKQNDYERLVLLQLLEYYNHQYGWGVFLHSFDLRNTFHHIHSNLLKSGGPIPEGHYEEESMSVTVVPGRNLIFSSIMAGVAESIGASEIALGVHSGDHAIYPDCRPEFIGTLRETVLASSEGKVTVIAPLLDLDKHDILKIGYALPTPVPYQLTRTCYKDQPISCGKCGSCVERLEAFEKLGRKDPIKYINSK